MGAYIPSIRLQIWLASATVGVGVDRISDGSLAFIAKLPMSVVKALQHGVAVDLLGVVVKVGCRSVPLAAIRVHDEADNPFTAVRGFLQPDEGELFAEALRADVRRLHIFDELSRHVLSCDINVDGGAAADLRRRMEEASAFSSIDEKTHERALDLFEHRVKGTMDPGDAAYGLWETVAVSVQRLDLAEYFAVSETAIFGPIRIDAADEGGVFEESMHELGDKVYGKNAYRAPRVRLGSEERELTDVLLVGDNHLVLIEAKALTRSG